jgi:hypothetical protein|tara:strand:- start:334 stop:534 length:201 start_codon:yes stop_codon:yes gene_type:complete
MKWPKEDSMDTDMYSPESQLRTQCTILESQLQVLEGKNCHLKQENERLTKLVQDLLLSQSNDPKHK